MYYVYILKTKIRIYIGCTKNLQERIKRHKDKEVPATCKEQPVKLICYFAFQDKYKAFLFEKYLKTGSGRAFLRKRLI